MKGPPKPDKDNPGDPIGATNGDTIVKLFYAIIFAFVITGIMMLIERGKNPDVYDIEVQEFRQNIADLQNRVYELESRE